MAREVLSFGERMKDDDREVLNRYRTEILISASRTPEGQIDISDMLTDDVNTWIRVGSMAAAMTLVHDGLLEIEQTNPGLLNLTEQGRNIAATEIASLEDV